MKKLSAAVAACLAFASAAQAAPIGIDGVIGAEWGAPTATVTYDPGAPLGNFGSPGTTNHIVGYSVYTRTDGNYLYGAVAASGPTLGNNFANIYYDVDGIGGSDLGIEVTNDRFFIPGVPGYTNDTLNVSSFFLGTGVIEWAIDWTMFTADPYNILTTNTAPGGLVTTRLSQSFGYSVAGGSSYGVNRLGAVNAPATVPEPTTLVLIGMALLTLFGVAANRRRQFQ